MTPNPLKASGFAFAALAAFASSSFGATLVFSEDFSGTGALHNSTTDTGSLTWNSSANNTMNGAATGGWNAKVAFTPVVGQVYLLTLTTTSTIGNALELGFGNSTTSFNGGDYDGLIQKVGNMQTARIGRSAYPQYNTYGSTVGGTRSHTAYTLDSNTGHGFLNTLTLQLDTTTSLAASQLTWSVNGVPKGTWTGNVTGYNSVFFGRGLYGGESHSDPSGNNTVDNIKLEVIPEPAAALLGSLGLLGLLRRRRA